ncbi:cadmium resistance transporter family protein [Agrilactobacillus composti DSM 18527 = JCM 14202]|uniref:Cadmium resistance transporter family protein n=1 Tax=Agrilactobacillus composti DSM 18527 = JCM 14202 TaxID=1423734 RepID=X0PT81_9LACO|nr:cadmium resistance transporter [Agrilactobacillus composti]KRM34631.1 cadmium resistance transporter family protein [Agrilactobacillus composti DSM 18527 = JCM 14202]GAF41202.1 cadmium resistance transporter [Agrilactobacillus composti DSM 18527 = JCM 14202]
MITTVVTSVLAFVSTNLDDIFVLTILFSQVNQTMKRRDVIIGQYLGIGSLLGVSIVATYSLRFITTAPLNWLGIVPILLGVRTWFAGHKTQKQSQLTTPPAQQKQGRLATIISPRILNVSLLTVANGADNIGVYLPLFSKYSPGQLVITTVVFALMIALWCYLGLKLASFPLVKAKLVKYKQIVIPIIFIVLGLLIIFK